MITANRDNLVTSFRLYLWKEDFSWSLLNATLSSCMDIAVRTGTTVAPHDVSLVSLQLDTHQGERVCLLVEITAKEKQSHAIERECEAIIRHALIETEGEAAERLDSALKELNGLLKGMLISGSVHDVHMIVSILDINNVLHVSHAGRAEAYLIRANSASQITEYSSGKPTPAFVHIASGGLEKGDILIFSTQRLLRSVTPAQLARITQNRDMILESITRMLEAEGEHAALAVVSVADSLRADVTMEDANDEQAEEEVSYVAARRARLAGQGRSMRRRGARGSGFSLPSLDLSFFSNIPLPSRETFSGLLKHMPSTSDMKQKSRSAGRRGKSAAVAMQGGFSSVQRAIAQIVADLHHPERKKRAHLLLIAAALVVLLIIWATVHLFTSSQRSKTSQELQTIIEQISIDIQTAENRRLVGEVDAAYAILQRAEERAKQVIDNQSGLFRSEANDLLNEIYTKQETINNIVRVTPRTVADLASRNSDIIAQGIVGVGNAEFIAFDKQDAYRVLGETVEAPTRLSEDVLAVDGADFPRYGSQVFLMNGNSVVEWDNGVAVSMKTDDANGWQEGTALSTYLRYIYILSPANNQIYKYERLNGRYGAPSEYNVNANLEGALDMAIDSYIYVLKSSDEGVSIQRLFRGEEQSFVIRGAPPGVLDGTTKIVKVESSNFYLLDAKNNRVIVVSDGGTTGEATYVRQFAFEGENMGTLKDMYVDEDESQLYVMDDKQIYVVDLASR